MKVSFTLQINFQWLKCIEWFKIVINCDQKAWQKPYIDMNTKLRQKAKINLKKDFLKLMNNAVFGKTMENVRKPRNTKFVTKERRRNCKRFIRTKLTYYKVFHRKYISNRNEKNSNMYE